MVTKLRTDYKEKIINSLYKSLNCTNIHQVPKLIKIKVNRGLGLAAQNTAVLNKTINEFRVITGQQPVVTVARNSVATFKIREENANASSGETEPSVSMSIVNLS